MLPDGPRSSAERQKAWDLFIILVTVANDSPFLYAPQIIPLAHRPAPRPARQRLGVRAVPCLFLARSHSPPRGALATVHDMVEPVRIHKKPMKTLCLVFSIAAAAGLAFLVAALAPISNSAPAPNSNSLHDSSRLNDLLTARYDSARRLLETEEKRLHEGHSTLRSVCEAARRVRDSAIELPLPPDERRAALASYVDLTRRLEESVSRVVEKGMAPASDKDLASYLRLDAEIALLRADTTRR
jgi:hypothetical protein